ncbi:MAG: hypothetical protein Q9211_000212 [Gyalolechia sp. 1 TL-2023]
MSKKALVTGATGLLGRQVVRAFDRAGAANRFPDKCDADPDGTRALNIAAARRVAQAARSRSILVIYVSTDYVFSGKPGEAPYEVHSVPHPTNLYGQTKLAGEKAVLEVCQNTGLGVVLRVPVLYGHAETNAESAVNVLVDAVWKSQRKDAHVSMDDWSLRYPTNTEDVARVLVDVAAKYLVAGDARAAMPKVLHFSSEQRFTKFQMCQLFAEILGLPLDGMTGTGEDTKATVPRPYDTHLSTKALKELGVDVWSQDFADWWYVFWNAHSVAPVNSMPRRRELKAFKR